MKTFRRRRLPSLFSALLLASLLCGCAAGKLSPSASGNEKFPVERTLSGERRDAALRLADAYIGGLTGALVSGEFAPLKKVLPKKLVSPKAEEIFNAMKAGLARFGKLESCTYYGMLDCTLFNDFLWKFRFVKETGDPRMPQQVYEVLYRVRVIHPEEKPVIIKADFLFR
ncbi:MAG: hypothetical protein IJS01_05755 [Lentisphaeria bacterium]|nr:hypothetical protein [Lentisphaeria bacterium]